MRAIAKANDIDTMGQGFSDRNKRLAQFSACVHTMEVMKQTNAQKPVRDAIEKELAKWREGVLSKAVLKAVEGKALCVWGINKLWNSFILKRVEKTASVK